MTKIFDVEPLVFLLNNLYNLYNFIICYTWKHVYNYDIWLLVGNVFLCYDMMFSVWQWIYKEFVKNL